MESTEIHEYCGLKTYMVLISFQSQIQTCMELMGGIIWRQAAFILDIFFALSCLIRFASK